MKFSIVMGCVWFSCAMALSQPSDETVITSNQLEFDYREYVVMFDGDVRVQDPQFTMQADRMFVFFEGTNDVRQVKAIGNVRFKSDDRSGACNTAVYVKETGQIVMTGNAELRRVNDYVTGDQITIWLDDQRMVTVPGRLVIEPQTVRGGREATP